MSEQRRPGARRKVDLRQAAEILDTSVDAVRKRISRGTLEGEKGPDGKLYTWLDLDQTANPEDASLSALVEAKDETIELLRQQLEQEREANRENRRLLAAALERIPELTAPEEASSETAPEPRESPETAAEEPGRDDVPQEQQEPSQRRSWWREFFGLE